MLNYIRIPRKLKKEMKKGVEWKNILAEREKQAEIERSLNLIFHHDYTNSRKVMRKIFRKGR